MGSYLEYLRMFFYHKHRFGSFDFRRELFLSFLDRQHLNRLFVVGIFFNKYVIYTKLYNPLDVEYSLYLKNISDFLFFFSFFLRLNVFSFDFFFYFLYCGKLLFLFIVLFVYRS